MSEENGFSEESLRKIAAQKVLDKTLVLNQSAPNALYPVVSFVTAALLLIALLATLLIFRKSPDVRSLDRGVKIALLSGALAYWSVFGFTIVKWRF